jgi:hypothetical protein
MKKIILIAAGLVLAMTMSAQLAWDTEMTKTDFDNAQTVISQTDNVSFSNPVLGVGGGLSIGKISVFSVYEDECVIALSQTGIADKLSFAWQGGSSGTFSVYQSADHNNWSLLLTKDGNTISTDTKEEMALATTTRYLKFAASAHTAVVFRKIKVTELKELSASTDEWPFGSGMVDDAESVKSVTINWTNIVAEVSSTDPHFSASVTTVGQKNLVNQSTQINILYSHAEAGVHSGEIVLAGEGREVRIAVSGTTNKYDQTLTWIQELGECIATDRVTLNAFTSSGNEVVYESSDSEIAYVENSVVQIVKAGTVTLTATQPGNYKFNAAEPISKTLVIKKADPMIGVTVDDITYGQTLSEAVIHEQLGLVEGSFSWVDMDPSTVLNAGDYALTVLFTPANEGIYNTRTMQVALHVNKAAQVITWDGQETALTVGEAMPSTAVLSSGLDITYAYTECLLTIENGVIMPENEGEVTVVAYHPGNENYLPTTVIMTVFEIAGNGDTTGMESIQHSASSNQKVIIEGVPYIVTETTKYDMRGLKIEN